MAMTEVERTGKATADAAKTATEAMGRSGYQQAMTADQQAAAQQAYGNYVGARNNARRAAFVQAVRAGQDKPAPTRAFPTDPRPFA